LGTEDDWHDARGAAARLHRQLTVGLGRWLDAQHIRWSWRSHEDGILHSRHDGHAGPGPLPAGRAPAEPEVVRPRDGDPVTLRPCPPWCTEDRHFADDDTIDAGDGYHHYGPETAIPTSYKYLGTASEPDTVIRVVLKSWTCPLHASPGCPVTAKIAIPAVVRVVR